MLFLKNKNLISSTPIKSDMWGMIADANKAFSLTAYISQAKEIEIILGLCRELSRGTHYVMNFYGWISKP